MKDRRLLLVYPEIKCSITNTHTYSLPLGLGSIATYCRQKIGDKLDVKILDGSLMSHQEQIAETQRFKPDVIGLDPTIGSQENSYEIAELAKTLGAKVIFGGVNSTNLWKNMLANRNFIDGVVLYEGEKAMISILNNHFSEPNIAYRDKNGRIHSPSKIEVIKSSELPDIDYSLFDLDRFFRQTKSRGFGKAMSYYAGKGCIKRDHTKLKEVYSFEEYNSLIASMNVCTFCGRNELGLKNFSEDREARIVRNLHDTYRVTGFFNVQDVVNLKNKSPIGLDECWFRLFVGAEHVTQRNIKRLKQRYGQNLILQVGIESADPKMREAYGKPTTNSEDIFSKLELMADEGVKLHASFILGGRGETTDSMLKTTDVARRLSDYDNVTWILISPQLILPGSPDFRALLQIPKMYRKYANQDLIDIAEINKDFLKEFSPHLTREQVIDEIKSTFDYIKDKKQRKELVLDVKGVMPDEERHINPSRYYSE